MARKKIEPIVSLGTDEDKLIVQKSLPLFALWRSDLTLAEFKILDTYLSRIDSHKPDKRTVVFTKGELEGILGVTKINKVQLDERLQHLMTTVKIEDASKKQGFTRIALFEKAVANQDDNGLWQVEMTCTPSAMKYIFNIENLRYLRYKLRCITAMKSRYTYIMFMHLEANRFRKSWEIDLEELKVMLNCDKEETYKAYKRFNDLVLKKIQKEMHEKTECRYSYEPVKKGRSVVRIRFTVETLPKTYLEDVDPNQYTIEEYLEQQEQESLYEPNAELWEQAIKHTGYDFTVEQKEELRALLVSVPKSKLPEDNVSGGEDFEIRKYHYINNLLVTINRRDSEKPIKNKFSYLVKMIKNDAGLV